MDFTDGFLSEEHRELLRCASESVDPSSISPLEICSPTIKRSPRTLHGKQSPKKCHPPKHDRQSDHGNDGSPKKGGKCAWGGTLDIEADYFVDPSDPNYDNNEEHNQFAIPRALPEFDAFKKAATVIIEEYFATDDIPSAAAELTELHQPSFHFYFVKKLISMAMDRHDKEREMAASLLSALYSHVLHPSHIISGFAVLLQSSDDLCLDIPDAVDILALFISRAVIDDILPPAFLSRQLPFLPPNSKGVEVIHRAEKGYLSAPLHGEAIHRRWGGSRNMSVEDVKTKINTLLAEYVSSGDKVEASRCVKDLKVPFFHHDIVKRALILAMERRGAEARILDFLRGAVEEGLINASQISKGFNRLIDGIDDLILDIPSARDLLQSLVSKAASEGWLSVSSLVSFYPSPVARLVEGDIAAATEFKIRAICIIKEYFMSGDILEVMSRLISEEEDEDDGPGSALTSKVHNAIFIKKLITLAMDRRNREKEMASILLTFLCFPAADVVRGFVLLVESAEDTALDIPAAAEDLAMFLARAVVDEVLAPSDLDEIGAMCAAHPVGGRVVPLAQSMLRARLSAERILRCWGGGGGGGRTGWEIEDVKEKIAKLLEEYDCGGDVREACRCIKELGMPFFHHEVVKKALVTVMEKRNDRLWGLLEECHSVGLITGNQMAKGFGRVADCMEDLVLDVPDVQKQFEGYVERAKKEGMLDSGFASACGFRHALVNGFR